MSKEQKQSYKEQKKLWNKGRRKAQRPFKGLTILSGFVAVVAIIAIAAFSFYHETINLVFGVEIYEVVDGDDSVVYYESDYESNEERIEYEDELVAEVESEGAVLLMNEDDALPLAEGAKVTLFSGSSVNLVYGGTGSGNVDADYAVDLREGLESVGIEVNETMWDFYETGDGAEYAREDTTTNTALSVDDAVSEVPWDVYTDDVLASVEDYGDAAIVVLSRIGGEGNDLDVDEEGGYLVLSDDERDMLAGIAGLKAEGVVDEIVVLLNSSNAIQLDFLFEDEYDLDACLWIGGLGDTGATGVARIISGEVNPSGSLVDTYLVDNLSNPAMVNFGSFDYVGATEESFGDDVANYDFSSNYVVYQEGIYVGYLYYETRYEDSVMGTGNSGDWSYSDDVAFSFGYGLSYTDFEWSDFTCTYDEATDTYVVQVTVTNVGDVAGKDVVQVYGQSPYTDYDVEYSVEKASAELVGFQKTDLLEPGESQTVTVTVDGNDMASYDAYGAGTYILEAGTYYLTAATDAHAAVNNILAAKGYSTADGMDAEGDTSLVYAWEEDTFDDTTYSVNATTGVEITNQFDYADINLSDLTGDQTITYLSRSDWEGTFPTETYQLELTDELAEELADRRYDADTYDGVYADAEMPTLGADNGVKAADLVGADYDDPLWDDLLDQMSAEDMALLLGAAFHWTQPIESIDLPATRDENGPQGLTFSLFGITLDDEEAPMATTTEDVLAATFNLDLAYEVGLAIGNDCLENDVDMLYGPAANIHRTAYAGRNYEYYSEDGFLSGKMAAAECEAISSKGIMVELKHFILNDQEEDRYGISVWTSEQAIREIYLEAFEDALTDSSIGVMTSFTREGAYWNGSNENLLTNVLRGEWGNTGLIMSDSSSFLHQYMDGVDGTLAGGGTYDAITRTEYNQLLEYVDDPVVVTAMREACHNVIYNIVNSAAMNGISSESTIKAVIEPQFMASYIALGVSGVCFVVCLVLWLMRGHAYKTANPKPRKKAFEGVDQGSTGEAAS